MLPYQAISKERSLADLVDSHPDVVRELDSGESRIPYVIIRGEVVPVKPDTGLSSQYSSVKDLKGVIQTFKLIEHKKHFSRSGFWFAFVLIINRRSSVHHCPFRYSSKRDIHTFVNEVPFGLVPGSASSSGVASLLSSRTSPLVEVTDWHDASRLVLDTTYDHFREAPSSVSEHLLGWMTGDIQKGVQSTEQGCVYHKPSYKMFGNCIVLSESSSLGSSCGTCLPLSRCWSTARR